MIFYARREGGPRAAVLSGFSARGARHEARPRPVSIATMELPYSRRMVELVGDAAVVPGRRFLLLVSCRGGAGGNRWGGRRRDRSLGGDERPLGQFPSIPGSAKRIPGLVRINSRLLWQLFSSTY